MRRMQTALAVLSVAIGVAAFGAVIGVRDWQQKQIRDLAVEFAPNVLVVRFAPQPGFVFERGQNYGITYDEAMALADLPGVVDVAHLGGSTTLLGGNVRVTRIPIAEQIFDVLALELAAGRPLEKRDAALGLPVTVLGAVIANELFGSAETAVGELVDAGGGSAFRVVGVLKPIPAEVSEFERLNVAALQPHSVTSPAFGPFARPAGSQAYVKHAAGQANEAQRAVAEAIARLPIAEATEVVSSDVWLGSQAVFRNQVADELDRGSSWIIVLALIAMVGNLANALGLRAVDRASVLAVNRALGATSFKAGSAIVLDALVVGGIGTVIGVALLPLSVRLVGSGIVGLQVTSSTTAYAATCGVVVSVLAAVVPAAWAIRMPIYLALREQLSPPVWDGIALTGMAAGALALVVASAIGGGTAEWFQQRVSEIGGNRLVVSTAVLGARTSVFSPPPLDVADAEAVELLPGVAGLAISASENASLLLADDHGERSTPVSGYRVDAAFFDVFPRPLLAGRTPTSQNETVIGTGIAELAFPGLGAHEVVGRSLRLGRPANVGGVPDVTEVTVVGVYASQPVVSIGDLYDSVIVRLRDPGASLADAFVVDLHMALEPQANLEQVKAAVAKTIDDRHAGGYAPAVVHEPAGDLSAARNAMASVASAWHAIAWLSFLIGGVGLATIVSVNLLRKRPEHALKRAIGATISRVAIESTAAALKIAAGAAAVGIVAALGITLWITTLAPWEFSVPLRPAIFALLVSMAVGLAAVIMPVIALGRFSPWSVLRGER